MTSRVFTRPPRLPPPTVDTDEVLLPDAAVPAPAESGAAWLTALPALTGLGSVAYLFAGATSPIGYLAGSTFLLSSLATAAGGVLRGRTAARTQLRRTRTSRLADLARTRERVRRIAADQRAQALWTGPHPDQLWTVVTGPRLWERRPADPDVGLVRIGVGPRPLSAALAGKDGPDDDPVVAAAVRRFRAVHGTRRELPLLVDVTGPVSLVGPRAATRALARSIVLQAAAFHAPQDLRIAVCAPDVDADAWSWVKWLPHAARSDRSDGAGPERLVGTDPAEVVDGLDGRVLLVLDRGGARDPSWVPPPGVGVLDLDGSLADHIPAGGTTLVLDGTTVSRVHDGRTTPIGRADAMPVPLAEGLARHLAGRRLATATDARDGTLHDLLGLNPAQPDVDRLRRGRVPAGLLRTPLGTGVDGAPVVLDIKEAAQYGSGPHGVVVGATGSGKSELLRTLVLGMCVTHDTDLLNLVLVDFKGGATFAGLAPLPHVAAVITNLEADPTLVDRMHDALSGELDRRQQVLRDAGDVTSLREYDRLRSDGVRIEPLPALWVVVDEFSELLAHRPDFADLFVRIGRLGRSLGVHLLLASQRVDEGLLRGLESHLAYRIALRTFSEAESRAVLGVPDAHALPAAPGHGLLRTDTAELLRFRAAWSSAPVALDAPTHRAVVPFTASRQPLPDPTAHGPTELDTLVAALAGRGSPARRVWLPPLDAPEPLDRLLPGLAVRPGRGFGSEPGGADLSAPVGSVDLPDRQRRDPLVVDLSGAAGHVAVVGGPRSGRSTLLTTVITALALRHTPAELQVHGLQLGGGGLSALSGLPHVGGIAARHEHDVAHRIVSEITALVAARERRFRELGVESMQRARALGVPDVLLAVDGWDVLRHEFEDLEEQLVTLAGRSLTFGVHLLLTAGRWLDLRLGLRDLVGTRLELKLGDALDSEVDRRVQQDVPADRPGRGVTADRRHFLAALPRIDGRSTTDDLADGLRDLVARVDAGWDGVRTPPVRLLPTSVGVDDLHADGVVLGVEGRGLTPVVVDPRRHTGLIVVGDPGSGRTSLLRSIGRQVLEQHPPGRAKIVLIDPRRSMLGEFEGDGVLSYAASTEQVRETVAGLVEGFVRRLPGADVTPEQLHARSWWTGPDVHVLVDDHDLLPADALTPLARFLPHARDVGLQLVVTRRAGGAARVLGDPVLGQLRELGQPVVVLSAPTEEGVLFGVRAAPSAPGRGTLVDRGTAVPVQLALPPRQANQ